MRIIDENLKYAQVVKHKECGHLIEIEKRVIWGTEEEILEIIQQEGRGETINTSYVESRNGNYRKDNKRLARRSACQSKEVDLHDAQIDLLTGIYNFVDENRAVYDVTMESSFRPPPHEQFLKGQTVIGETLKHRR